MTIYIYALCCPISGEIRYVGKTVNLRIRLNHHWSLGDKCHRSNWISGLKKLGMRPVVEVLETLVDSSDDDWQVYERFWIAYLRFIGCRLTNLDSGGWRGKRCSPETKKRISAANTGKKRTPESREKMRMAQLGAVRSLSHRMAAGAARRGYKMPDAQKAKIGEANRGRVYSAESIARMSAGQKRRFAKERAKRSLDESGPAPLME